VAVVGGGVAGLIAAGHAARLGRWVKLFEASGLFGGLVATVGALDGVVTPGDWSGQDLAMCALGDAQKRGVEVMSTGIDEVVLGTKIMLRDQAGERYYPEALVIAAGASLRHLRVPGEAEFAGRGVSRCATCDGGFFRDADVAVIGAGDAAAQQALILAATSRRVTIFCRHGVKAKRDYVDRLTNSENVAFIFDSEVSAILGDDRVSALQVRNIKTGDTSEQPCAGVFPFIGTTPNTAFVPASLLTPGGHVAAASGVATSDPRVFAAGAVRSGYGGQILQAMADGTSAAEAAARVTVL
jgi:thioredoxin reductase (NADPH)